MVPPLEPGNEPALTEYDHYNACDDCQLREAQAEQAARRHLLRSARSESARSHSLTCGVTSFDCKSVRTRRGLCTAAASLHVAGSGAPVR